MVAFARPHDPVDRADALFAADVLEPAPLDRDLAARGLRLHPGERPARELLLLLETADRRSA